MPSVTLNFSAAHATRIQDALTETFDLDTPATVEDYKQYLIRSTKQLVRASEQRVAAEAATSVITDVDVT